MSPNNERTRARNLGAAGESDAREFLQGKGLQLLDAGWRCRLGELDLVMRDGETLVFIEVRTRRAGSTVSAIESIGNQKQGRFVRAARAWLSRHPKESEMPARFDVIAIDGGELHWLRDAFTVAAY